MTTNSTRAKAALPILALVIISGCSTTPTSEVNTGATEAEKVGDNTAPVSVSQNPNALNCRSIKPTGSRIAKRICRTSSEWNSIRETDQALAESARPTAVPAPTGQ
jgi:hypothetical protein